MTLFHLVTLWNWISYRVSSKKEEERQHHAKDGGGKTAPPTRKDEKAAPTKRGKPHHTKEGWESGTTQSSTAPQGEVKWEGPPLYPTFQVNVVLNLLIYELVFHLENAS